MYTGWENSLVKNGLIFKGQILSVPDGFLMKLLIKRGSYMCAHVLFNLLKELEKRDKMRGLSSILSLFRNELNKFNNTRA